MSDKKQKLIFGLDIGTRSVIGIVGYRLGDKFHIVAMEMMEHETRAMLDGQIHDIAAVSGTIAQVKFKLEAQLDCKLTEACIAAAGRVLRTHISHVEYEFDAETTITDNELYILESMGVEKAYEELMADDDTGLKFYCVGYSVIRYFINDNLITVPENHKARKLSAEIIATFLPDDVVNGLYAALEMAGLTVLNMTLEPIAAIELAIPQMYRMLNIALIDVGAGTSDISITRDGSIVAYGMLPIAGDALTEDLARHCLVDFVTADNLKRTAKEEKSVVYRDIIGIRQEISYEEIAAVVAPRIDEMAQMVSEKIKELNGAKPVSAVFIVGGGGIIEGYASAVAKHLDIPEQRVALRGKEVMQKIVFHDTSIPATSMLVTPIGICLNYFEQSNNFIYVNFNGKRVKLYDNNKLMIVDVAIQADFPNDGLFPRRGKSLNYTVNGAERLLRGTVGEAAQIKRNGEIVDLYTAIRANDKIEVTESTAGDPAALELGKIPEFKASISVEVDKKTIKLPKIALVNAEIQNEFYAVKENDAIEILGYYTVAQIIQLMDLVTQSELHFFVNSMEASMDTKVYDNFTVSWIDYDASAYTDESEPFYKKAPKDASEIRVSPLSQRFVKLEGSKSKEELNNRINGITTGTAVLDKVGEVPLNTLNKASDANNANDTKGGESAAADASGLKPEEEPIPAGMSRKMTVIVNNLPVHLEGKPAYVYVDVFENIKFDLSKPQGRNLITNINGRVAQFMEPLKSGDRLDIYWEE